MRVALALLALALLAAPPSSAQTNPLLGAWKSDRELTLQRLAADNVPPEHRKEISEEVDLGNAIVEFHESEYVWLLGKQVRRLPYKIRSIEGNYVEIEYFIHRAATKPNRMRLFVSGDLLYTPIEELRFYEVFRRVRPTAAPSAPAAPSR
jgi:hypothetical protein